MTVLQLRDREPVASGSARWVYSHPDDPRYLIKITKKKRKTPWYNLRRRRYGDLLPFMREIREQCSLWNIEQRHPQFIQKVVGMVETDLGPGLVVERAQDRDGRTAPTLAQLIQAGRFDARVEQDLEEFYLAVLRSTIVARDFNPQNLLYAYDPELGHHFVLVDGIGHKALIPLHVIVPWINRQTKLAEIARSRAEVARLRQA